jgi:SPX domain protein involved in polyphosphate accumulation
MTIAMPSLYGRYGNNPPSAVFVERKTHKESWKGEESVKERFLIREDKVVPFIDGEQCSGGQRMRLLHACEAQHTWRNLEPCSMACLS